MCIAEKKTFPKDSRKIQIKLFLLLLLLLFCSTQLFKLHLNIPEAYFRQVIVKNNSILSLYLWKTFCVLPMNEKCGF